MAFEGTITINPSQMAICTTQISIPTSSIPTQLESERDRDQRPQKNEAYKGSKPFQRSTTLLSEIELIKNMVLYARDVCGLFPFNPSKLS